MSNNSASFVSTKRATSAQDPRMRNASTSNMFAGLNGQNRVPSRDPRMASNLQTASSNQRRSSTEFSDTQLSNWLSMFSKVSPENVSGPQLTPPQHINDELQKKCNQLTGQNESLKENVSKLTKNNSDIQTRLDNSEKEMEKLKQDYESKLALALQNFQTCEDEKQQIKEDYERRITLEIQEKKAIQVQYDSLNNNCARLTTKRRHTDLDDGPSRKMSNPPIPSDRLNFLVDELKKENDQLNLQLNSKDLKIAELEKNRASSTDYQDKYNQLERSKKEQLIENNKEVERLKLQLKKANDRLSSANVSIAEEKKASDKYKAELAEKSELFEKLLDRANEISAKYNDLIVTSEEESEKLQSLQEELDKTVKEANTHLSQHNDLVAKLKNELDAAKTSIAQLKTELSAVKSNKDLQSRLHKNKYNSMQDELNKQIASLQTKIDEQNLIIETNHAEETALLNETVENQAREIVALNELSEKANTDLAERDKTIINLTDQLKAMETENRTRLQSLMSHASELYDKYKVERNELEAQINVLKVDNAKLEQRCKEQDGAISKLNDALNKLNLQVAEIASLKGTIERLQQESQYYRSLLEKARQEADNWRNRYYSSKN